MDNWDDEGGRKPLVRQNNFERFVASETISEWDEWQACFKRHFHDRAWVFRGHTSAKRRLVPSLERATLKTIAADQVSAPRWTHYHLSLQTGSQ